MRRSLKVLIWVLVFSASAGAGAFVASRTNPFPPGVEDPGDRLSPPPTGSPKPERQVWAIEMRSATRHEFHVGGACRTTWEGEVTVTISPGGRASGLGLVSLVGGARCDFEVAQVQAKQIALRVEGTLGGQGLELMFREGGRTPVGSKELGGFADTLSGMRPTVREGERIRIELEKPDGDLGRYVSVTDFSAECVKGC